MNICRVCAVAKPPEDFSYRNSVAGVRHYVCRRCFADYSRVYYRANIERYRDHRRRNMARYRRRNKVFVIDYLLTHPCVDCGIADPTVLEFDHVRGLKRQAVSELVDDGVSLCDLRSEIEKCVVRCANCHRRKTVQERRWYKGLKNEA